MDLDGAMANWYVAHNVVDKLEDQEFYSLSSPAPKELATLSPAQAFS